MKVVVLCGGEGTRLREETEFRPKPMVEVGGRPILWHIMKLYAHHGFQDFVLCLGYRGWDIKEYFLNYRAMNSDLTIQLGYDRAIDFHARNSSEDWRVTLVETGLTAMTGARVKRIARYLDADEDFMLTYGDGLADIDLQELHRFHRDHGKIATLTAVRTVSRFGELDIAQDGVVSKFSEKPMDGANSRIGGGYFVFKPSILDYLSTDEHCVLERGPLQALARAGELVGYRHDGFWQCMDTYREYLSLNEQWSRGEAPWAVWQQQRRPRHHVDIPPPVGASENGAAVGHAKSLIEE